MNLIAASVWGTSRVSHKFALCLEIIDAKWLPRDCHCRRKSNRHSMVISASLRVYLKITRLTAGSSDGFSLNNVELKCRRLDLSSGKSFQNTPGTGTRDVQALTSKRFLQTL